MTKSKVIIQLVSVVFTVNGTKSEFVYLDGKLVYEKRGGDDIFYLYDSYGNISNIRWYKNGASSPTNIYVITNRQGDVLGLYDYAGTRKVSYEYDAWGNTVSVTDTSEEGWSTLNPFRYRGYYFDTETGLYYLLSRYYDPTVGRFLNADGYLSTGVGILGFNMFAYCNNNPVAFSDGTGTKLYGALDRQKEQGVGGGILILNSPLKYSIPMRCLAESGKTVTINKTETINNVTKKIVSIRYISDEEVKDVYIEKSKEVTGFSFWEATSYTADALLSTSAIGGKIATRVPVLGKILFVVDTCKGLIDASAAYDLWAYGNVMDEGRGVIEVVWEFSGLRTTSETHTTYMSFRR